MSRKLLFSISCLLITYIGLQANPVHRVKTAQGTTVGVEACADGIYRIHISPRKVFSESLMERYGLQMTLALLSESIPVYNPEKYCDNVVVGAALGFYIQTAREEGVKIRVRVQVPATNRDISDASLCVIFGNLLENAIEACRLVKGERFIKLSARVNGEMLFITMDNCSPGGSVQKSGGLFASGKGAGRGLGLSSVCSIAERHGGSARFRDENGVFQSEVCVRL